MRTLAKLSLVVPILICSAGVGANSDGDWKAIEAGYAKLCSAIKRKDTKGVLSVCTKDFVWVDANGKITKYEAFAAMMKSQMAMKGLVFHEASMKNDSYDFMGNECRVRNKTTMKMSAIMDGKRMYMTGVSEGVDTWRRTPQGWKACRVEIVHESQEYGG